MYVRDLIKSYRTVNGLTQQEMADKMNMSKQTYARMEKGKTEMTDNKINAFSKIIKKTPSEIREMADKGQLFPVLQENENHATQETGNNNNITINHYYGDKELSLENQYLRNLLAEKDKQIALLENLLATLQQK